MHIKLQNKEQSLDFKQFVYITLPQAIYEELMHYTKEFTTECSGCGLIEEVTHKYKDTIQIEYLVKEVFLPEEQDNSGAGTEYDGEQVAKIITDCVQQNKITNDTHLRFHWHSHVNMSVYHSGTDEENYDDIQCGDWLVSMVLNKSGDIMGSVHYYKPMRFDVDSIPVYVETGEVLDTTHADRNIAKVKEYEDSKPKTVTYGGSRGVYGGYDAYDPAYSGSDLDADYDLYNRGDASEAEFHQFLEALKLIEHSGEYEHITDNVIKSLTSNKYFEVWLDGLSDYEGRQAEMELLQAQEDDNVSTK